MHEDKENISKRIKGKRYTAALQCDLRPRACTHKIYYFFIKKSRA